LYCVVKLRYALRASSIESSESQGLETISWSSARWLIEDCRKGAIAGAGLQGRCRSAVLAGSGSNKLTIPELLGLRDLGLHFPPSSIWDFGGGESGHSSRLVVSGKERGWRCGMCLVVEAGEVVSPGVHFAGQDCKDTGTTYERGMLSRMSTIHFVTTRCYRYYEVK
jgi:hypothetical protein